jgi:hypothetical protein
MTAMKKLSSSKGSIPISPARPISPIVGGSFIARSQSVNMRRNARIKNNGGHLRFPSPTNFFEQSFVISPSE